MAYVRMIAVPDPLFNVLQDRVRTARERYDQASGAFSAVLDAAIGGTPEGTDLIHNLAQKWAAANNAFTQATFDLAEFSLRGTISRNLDA